MDNGGPAFPSHGMTLRDYFAAKAMQGFAAHNGLNVCGPNNAAYNVAGMAYEMADAMLQERNK